MLEFPHVDAIKTGGPGSVRHPGFRAGQPRSGLLSGRYRTSFPSVKSFLINTWLDQKAIWTSPFHLDKEDAEWWAAIGAVTAGLIVTDWRTTHWLENSNGQVRWGNNISHIGAVYAVMPEVAGFYLDGVLADNQKARETGVLGGEALLDGLIVMEVLKVAAGRDRPNDPKHPGDFFHGGASFPSGHSMETWALASVIATNTATGNLCRSSLTGWRR